ncbi:MAG: replication-associated recombination protein A [Burkholderiales bacterium]|nr:replication-associated recombination protein A [Phycisphaerae bacterium]
MDLFAQSRQKHLKSVAPLAVRMRPRTLDEFIGQTHFLAPGKLLRRMLEADRLMSVLFYGPPGTGKTSLASLIATHTKSHFEQMNAASAGVKEVRQVLDLAKDRLGNGGQRTVLFLDEIHRFNRAQQDILLGDVEAGLIILIGATTENPFFAVNSALVSRSQIFQFEAISNDDIKSLLLRTLADKERGLGNLKIEIDDKALDLWAEWSDGDARRALSALEVAALSQLTDDAGNATPIRIDQKVAEESMQRKAIAYDGTGDEHYDAASALIKSMRGSDPDAAIYWVARMLEAGEDPRFIARRIAILASEDIGMADPQAVVVAAACYEIVERIGMPECQLTLGHAAIYMAMAPKSNASAMAIWAAMKDAKEGRTLPVPKHLRDTHYKGSARLEHGKGYQYPHDADSGHIQQDYLGIDKNYYRPKNVGYEATVKSRLDQLRQGQGETDQTPGATDADK